MRKQTLYEDEAVKAIISVPGWAQVLSEGRSGKISSPSDAYCYVPLIYRAVNIRAKALRSIPYHLERNGEPIKNNEWPVEFESYFPETFQGMMELTESALLLSGGNIWKKRKSKLRTKTVQWVNPNNMTVEYNQGAQAITFKIHEKEVIGIDDVVYFRRYHPGDDVGLGIGEGAASLGPAKLLFYMNAFAEQFFAHGAMPQVILGVPVGTADKEVDRLEGWFKQAATGIKKAFGVLGIRTGDGGIKPTILTPELKSLAMPELYAQAKQQVAQAFAIPQTMLEDAANYATAAEHRISFWHDTIRPEGEFIQDVINMQLLKDYGIELVLDFDTMDQFQQDEKEMAEAFAMYMATGAFPPSLIAGMLGLELPDGEDAKVLDQWYEDHYNSITPQGNEPVELNDFKAELRKWQSHVLKRVKRGRDAVGERSFESDIIPSVLIVAAEEQMKGKDEISIRRIFTSLEEWKGYP